MMDVCKVNAALGDHLDQSSMLSKQSASNVCMDRIQNKDADAANDLTDDVVYGPVTEEEAERLQREANEDTTKSEDLRMFLKEMHQRLHEETQPQRISRAGQLFHPGLTAAFDASHFVQQDLGKAAEIDLETGTRYHHLSESATGGALVHRQSLTDLNTVDSSPAPDGGWGWFVVFGCFCCMILVEGICLSYGLLVTPVCTYPHVRAIHPINYSPASNRPTVFHYTASLLLGETQLRPELGSCVPISEMGEDLQTQRRMLLQLPGALLIGIYLVLSPLVSALSNQLEFRPVAATGSIISTAAIFASSYAKDIASLSATLGILGGIGLALIYLPAISTVGQWFHQRRPLAVGLALCGSGVGCLLGAQLMCRLVIWLTWRGALVITAAICLQLVCVIALFRPLEVQQRVLQVKREKQQARRLARHALALQQMSRNRRAAASRLHAISPTYEASQRSAPMMRAGVGQGALVSRYPASTGGVRAMGMVANVSPGGTRRGYGGLGKARQFVLTTPAAVAANTRVLTRKPGQPMILGVERGSRGGPQPNRSGQVKRAPPRRVVYGGSIMQQIIEEKRRQRTTSVGSLDGMVITRDNRLIAAPSVVNLNNKPLISASFIERISEAVARKIDLRMTSQQQASQSNLSETSPPVDASGQVAGTSVTSRMGLSRSQLRASLPHVVQEYIHSQLSVSMAQQQPSHKTSLILPAQATPSPPAASSTTSTVSNPAANQPLSTAVHGSCSGETVPHGPKTTVGGRSGTQSEVASAVLEGHDDDLVARALTESPSLCRTGSDTSLTSDSSLVRRNKTAPPTIVTSQVVLDSTASGAASNPFDLLLLDEEIKADIDSCLQRELSRAPPAQYKHSSVIQLDSLPGGGLGRLDSPGGLSATTPVVPVDKSSGHGGSGLAHDSSLFLATGVVPSLFLRSSAKLSGGSSYQRRSGAQLVLGDPINDLEMHNSQSDGLAAGAANASTFIPPAPCPSTVQLPTALLPLVSVQLTASAPVEPHQASLEVEDPLSYQHSPTSVCDGRQGSRHSDEEDENAEDDGQLVEAGDDDLDLEAEAAVDVGEQEEEEEEDIIVVHHQEQQGTISAAERGDSAAADRAAAANLSRLSARPRVKSLRDCCCPPAMLQLIRPFWARIVELLSPNLLASPTFGFMLLSTTVTMLGLVTPFVMLPELLAELNVNLIDSAFVISAIGAGNTIGRLLATVYIEKGWSLTYGWANCLLMNNASLILSSITVILMPLVRVYYTFLVIDSFAFGFFSGAFVSLKSILVVELLGMEKLTNAFGYMLIAQGLAACVGTPIAGYLRDRQLAKFPVYNVFTAHEAPVHHASAVAFYFSSACLFCAGLIACPLRRLSRWELVRASPPGVVTAGAGASIAASRRQSFTTGQQPGLEVALSANQLQQQQQHRMSRRVDAADERAAVLPTPENPGIYLAEHSQQQQEEAAQGAQQLPQVDNEGSVMLLGTPATASTSAGSAAAAMPIWCPDGGESPVENVTGSDGVGSPTAVLVPVSGISGEDRGTAALIAVPVSGATVYDGLLTAAGSAVATATVGSAVDLLAVPGETGLEPVVEEEEEEEEEDDEAEAEVSPQGGHYDRLLVSDHAHAGSGVAVGISGSSSNNNPTGEEVAAIRSPLSGKDESGHAAQTTLVKKRKRRRSTPASQTPARDTSSASVTATTTSSSSELMQSASAEQAPDAES